MRFVIIWIVVGVNVIASIVKPQSTIEVPEEYGTLGHLLAADTLNCHRIGRTFDVVQRDENGKKCEGRLYNVMTCWGRCDSNEIADWRFPYKKSSHPVCVHYGRNRIVVKLPKCEDGVVPGTEYYEYMEAADCRCQQCSSSDTSCEGLRYRAHRSETQSLSFLVN